MNIPVLRRSVRDTTGSVYTSPTLASQYNQMANWNRRLGRSFGMKEPFEFKMLRRAVAAVLPGKSPLTPSQEARGLTNPVVEGERSQAMGHVNGSIHERSYRNQIVDADIVFCLLGNTFRRSDHEVNGPHVAHPRPKCTCRAYLFTAPSSTRRPGSCCGERAP
jgi:hypothetical protein